jgi:hypothetical protein
MINATNIKTRVKNTPSSRTLPSGRIARLTSMRITNTFMALMYKWTDAYMIVIHDLRLIIMTKAKNILSMNKLTITEFRVGKT